MAAILTGEMWYTPSQEDFSRMALGEVSVIAADSAIPPWKRASLLELALCVFKYEGRVPVLPHTQGRTQLHAFPG